MTQPIHPVLERVARAMFEHENPSEGPRSSTWDSADVQLPRSHIQSMADWYRDCARAAVQALMEPDEGMVDAGMAADSEMSVVAYQAMLRPLVEGEGE